MTNFISFTGHRPQDLPTASYQQFAGALDSIMDALAVSNPHFITGGALGVDTWAALYAQSRHIPNTIILPFDVDVMSKFWLPVDKARLQMLVEEATQVVTVHHGGYDIRAYQQRNERMVDASKATIACWTGKLSGGTANCIRYAQRRQHPLWNMWPLDGRLHSIPVLS